MSELHRAARDGSVERAVAELSRGPVDIDQRDSTGFTPLMFAAGFGHSHIVSILLSKGANVAVVNDDGAAALHISAQQGHLAATKLLVKAGADLEARFSNEGSATPLRMVAEKGHSEVVRVLIEAGANRNSRKLSGSTPLYAAAYEGYLETVKVLLRAKANPLLAHDSRPGSTLVPLDAAAQNGHLEIVHEMIQEHGIQGCGGVSGGIDALENASKNQHVSIMELLTSAGVVDTGKALVTAAACGRESFLKFLLQQQEWKARAGVESSR